MYYWTLYIYKNRIKKVQWTIDQYNFLCFLPIPQYNNFHGSEITTLLRHPLAEDFSGLELARDC